MPNNREDNSMVEVKNRFLDPREFAERHKKGVEADFELEKWEVTSFNKLGIDFKAWPITIMPGTKPYKSERGNTFHSVWLFLVEFKKLECNLPDEGDYCELSFWKTCPGEGIWWHTERITMPYNLLGPGSNFDKYGAFRVKVVEQNCTQSRLRSRLVLDDKFQPKQNLNLWNNDAMKVMFKLRVSDSTMSTELDALRTMMEARADEKRGMAFAYWTSLRNPGFYVNLIHHLPHLKEAGELQLNLREKVEKKKRHFDSHQKRAFDELLTNIPCGVCILPGGPGAGKTTWNLTVAAMAQAMDTIRVDRDQEVTTRPVKILYLIDINKPLSDVATRMVKLYRELGMDKRVLRMYSWRFNLTETTKRTLEDQQLDTTYRMINKADRPTVQILIDKGNCKAKYPSDQNVSFQDYSPKFLEAGGFKKLPPHARVKAREDCLAHTLDEAAWETYEAGCKEGKYQQLAAMMEETMARGRGNDYFKSLLSLLYADMFKLVDFIATTPVAASKHLIGKFEPDLVFFDEAPHAREASTLIPLAKFNPIAFIFTGDPKQTRPFVRHARRSIDDSMSSLVPSNPWRSQLEVSMMERADTLRVPTHALLINHRARAGLHRLISSAFYDNKMETGMDEASLVPQSTQHLKQWLSRMGKNTPIDVPRVRISFFNADEESDLVEAGSSVYNRRHLPWVMRRVAELVTDPNFKQPDGMSRGTILIVTPFKEAQFRYRNAIRDLLSQLDKKNGKGGIHSACTVDARTIDKSQGHEADVVFLDLVRHYATTFIENPFRLSVAISRARQAELIIANDDMLKSHHYVYGQHIRRIFKGIEHTFRCTQPVYD